MIAPDTSLFQVLGAVAGAGSGFLGELTAKPPTKMQVLGYIKLWFGRTPITYVSNCNAKGRQENRVAASRQPGEVRAGSINNVPLK